MGLQGWWFFLWFAMMEIQFELEDETSFTKYLEYACLRCQGKIISLWIGTSQPSFISFERSSWDMSRLHLSDLRPPPDKYCSWNKSGTPVEFGTLSQYLPRVLYIPGGCFEFLPSTMNQTERCKKNKAIPQKKNAELCIPKLVQNIPTVESCWQSTKSFPSQKSHTGKGIPKCPNATRIST